MKNKTMSHRQSMPAIAVDPATAPAAPVEKKPALWRRVVNKAKAVVSSTVKVIATPFRAVARKLAPSKALKAVAAVARRVYRAVTSFVQKASPGLRMFSRLWAFGLAVGVWLGLLIAAPEVCIALTFLTGLALIGLAKLVEFADANGGWVLRFVEMLDTALWIAGWTVIGLLTAAVVTASVANAVMFVLMAAFWVVYRWPVVVAEPAQAPQRGSVIDAEVQEVVLPTRWQCVACGTTEGAIRINGWCKACFHALEDDFAQEAGKRRNTTYTLEPTDYKTHLFAARASREDADHVYWAETSWRVDRKGLTHPRTWTGFLQGSAIAHVDYHHGKDKHDRMYRAFLRESSIGTYWRLDTAKTAIVEHMVDIGFAIANVARPTAAKEAPVESGGVVLSWSNPNS